MTQALQAKQGSGAKFRAGWILDYWVASLLAALERAIRRRCARPFGRMVVPAPDRRSEKIGIKPAQGSPVNS